MLRPYDYGDEYKRDHTSNMPTIKPNRRNSLRLSGYGYAQPGAYFVTMVTHQRESLFGDVVNGTMQLNEYGIIAKERWLAIPHHFPNVELGTFVIMPNHEHGIIIITDTGIVGAQHAAPLQSLAPLQTQQSHASNPKSGSLSAIVRSYKSAVTKRIHETDKFSPEKIWQRGFHDHIIRNEDEWRRIHLYIEANPSNWENDDENFADF